MSKGRITIAAGILAMAAVPVSADFPLGIWHGAMTAADGRETAISLEFSNMAGRPLAMMAVPGSGDLGLSSIAFEDDALSFSYRDGQTWLRCELARQADGAYVGPCSAGNETVNSIRVAPAD
jgi:hypothetical protein